MKTPKIQKVNAEQKKSSGKKLVQARLPFKILSTPTSETEDVGVATKVPAEARKRKLSYKDQEASVTEHSSKRRSVKLTKEKVAKKTKEEAVVVLSDSDHDGEHNIVSKENLKTIARPKLSANQEESSDIHSDDVELIESSEEEQTEKCIEKNKGDAQTTRTTPGKKSSCETATTKKDSNEKLVGKATRKSTTPVSGKKASGGVRKSAGLQIKLPTNSKKNKRRKQSAKEDEIVNEQHTNEVLSDDTEVVSKELHPQKRLKLDVANEKDEKTVKRNNATRIKEKKDKNNKTIESSKRSSDTEEPKLLEDKPVEREVSQENEENKKPTKVTETNENKKLLQSEDIIVSETEQKSKTPDQSSTASDLEADTEAETTVNSDILPGTTTQKNGISSHVTYKSGSPKVNGDMSIHKMQKKNLTPKQQKLLEQRLKAREEKERKIQEERLEKQREKEEREQAKKREREEKEEQRRKDREEKEDQRRKEREEKEQKRLAEVEAKNEEKRKRIEAKEEEQRKKEEERKRKEQEKEEVEMKKKKAALAFTKFFSRPTHYSTGQRSRDNVATDEEHELLAFRPFQIKGDMKLAPIVRKKLTENERELLTMFVEERDSRNLCDGDSRKLYLRELKSGCTKPFKWCRPNQSEVDPVDSKQDDEDDDEVLIIEDELERAGQAIVEEHNLPIERFRAKFYKFHENRRPPFFGTWRKKSTIIKPRRPFEQDKNFFDYDVDSDDEWEEEEPGESLDGSDDDKEKESEDDDYEVDNEWFVPHGHLSEEELQNEDEIDENNDREAQKAKLQILQQEFAQEMKKKTEKLKPRLIGCIWVDENGNQPELCPKIIWETLNMRSILCDEPPIINEIKSTVEKNNETSMENGQNGEKGNGEIKLKPITLNENMLKQLVRLVHGNTHSKNFLIQEFIAYIEANEESVRNGDMRGPLKSTVREKIDEYAQWQVIEASNHNNESNKNGNNKNAKTPKTKKKLCWIVSEDMLRKMNLDIDLNNNWQYLLQPRIKSKIKQKEESERMTTTENGEDSNENSETNVDQTNTASNNATNPETPKHVKNIRNPDIKKFTKVMTAEEKAQQLQKQVTSSTSEPGVSAQASKNNSPKQSGANQTPTTKKRVPLLISVARGQAISTPDKNARISQFLKTINDAKQKEKDKIADVPLPMETDGVVVLE